MKVSLVIPFIDTPEIVTRCVELAIENARLEDTEFVLIDNGSEDVELRHRLEDMVNDAGYEFVSTRNLSNVGVLATFPQGFAASRGDVIAFIHSDVLLQEFGWDRRLVEAFGPNEKLGLAGLFGARALHPGGGREYCMSNMQGKEWGKCDCHAPVAYHHGELIDDIAPAAMFDGLGLFFRRETLQQLIDSTDMFEDWRAPHHFYDRIIGCKVAELGWQMAVIGIAFDHFSGATANSSDIYNVSMVQWLNDHGHDAHGQTPDKAIYDIAEEQFFHEFNHKLPLRVDSAYNYSWFRS